MGNMRNPGVLAVAAGVALAVLFALLGVTTVLDSKIGFGLAAVCLVVSALIYVFYSRGSAVEKTGYGALLFIIAVAFVIPLLMINQQQSQATATAQLYDLKLQRGAALFGQYCATCHGFQGQGLTGPKLNNNPTVNKLSNDDLTRIISGGIADPNDPSKLLMPNWLNTLGGSLTEEQISYLVAMIRSSDPTYRSAQGLADVNGFDYVLGTLTNPTQIAQYKDQEKSGSKPPSSTFLDLTGQSTVTIDALDVTGGAVPWGWVATDPSGKMQTANIIIKAGTTVTWGNKSSAPHNVVSGPSGKPDGKFSSPGILLANSPDTYSFKFTTPGEYPYYCGIHPAMVGWISVQP